MFDENQVFSRQPVARGVNLNKSGAPLSLTSPSFLTFPFPSSPLPLEVGPNIAAMGLVECSSSPTRLPNAFWCNLGFLVGLLWVTELWRFCDWKKQRQTIRDGSLLIPYFPSPAIPSSLPLQAARGFVEHCELPQWGTGEAPIDVEFWLNLGTRNHVWSLWWHQIVTFSYKLSVPILQYISQIP